VLVGRRGAGGVASVRFWVVTDTQVAHLRVTCDSTVQSVVKTPYPEPAKGPFPDTLAG